MPTVWLIILYFFIKSNFWKKTFLYLGFIFLIITSIPIVPTYFGKLFYCDSYKISNNNKKPVYVLVPGAGTYYDGYEKRLLTPETIKRARYGKELSEQFSIPIIFSGSGDAFVLSKHFYEKAYLAEFESTSTFEMAKNLKKIISISDGTLLLATKPLHHRRTILALKKQSFDIMIPDNYQKNVEDSYSIMPSVRSLSRFNDIIYEFLGITWYFLTGKI